MNKKTITISLLVIVAIVAIIVFWNRSTDNVEETIGQSDQTTQITSSGLTQVYENENFSFNYAPDMKAREIVADDLNVVVVEGGDSTNGFQVVISSFPNETLKPSDVGQYLQGASADNIRDLTVGYTGKGFIFHSNNPSFDGDSIEAWFAYNGKLYQVTTYKKNEQLMLSSLATWNFK